LYVSQTVVARNPRGSLGIVPPDLPESTPRSSALCQRRRDAREACRSYFPGNLYQISTYARLDPLLQAMFGTWKFF
jgi:hypothetical protein